MTMEIANKLTILRNFTARQVELSNADKAWCWTNGVALFPEARCPFCSSAITSNRIWQVANAQLLGRWSVTDGKLVKEDAAGKNMHPHVNGTNICMGRMTERSLVGEGLHNDSELTALFLGMSPVDSYWGGATSSTNNTEVLASIHRWKSWLLDVFDHQCEPYCGRGEVDIVCQCEEHQLARGEMQRCILCGFAGPLFAPHACYCACRCGCRPGVRWGGRSPCICGCVACVCRGVVPETPVVAGQCACGCECRPDRGECGCGHPECRCDDVDEESPSYYCDWCEESDDHEHEHSIQLCVDCEDRFDCEADDRYEWCDEMDHYVCPDCVNDHSHDE